MFRTATAWKKKKILGSRPEISSIVEEGWFPCCEAWHIFLRAITSSWCCMTTTPPPPPSRSWLCRRRRWNYLSSCCCFGSGMNSRCWQSRSSFSTPKKLLHSITDLLFSFPAKWAAAAATLTKRNEEASATFKVSLIMAAWLCSPQHTREWGLTLGPATSLPLENYKM